MLVLHDMLIIIEQVPASISCMYSFDLGYWGGPSAAVGGRVYVCRKIFRRNNGGAPYTESLATTDGASQKTPSRHIFWGLMNSSLKKLLNENKFGTTGSVAYKILPKRALARVVVLDPEQGSCAAQYVVYSL